MSDDEPSSSVDHPKRPSFREANLGPEPTPRPPQRSLAFIRNRKRTVAISLVVMGLGTAAVVQASHRRSDCEWEKNAQGLPLSQCDSHGTSGSGSRSFFSFNSSGGSSGSDHASVSRGGFGSTGSAHASASS